jgi:Uma2 family endonuclease
MTDALEDRYYPAPVTYTEYCTIEERVEVINGAVYAMSAPLIWHQRASIRISSQLENALKGKPCEPFAAPVDVRLFYREDDRDTTIVQPDILIVCDESKVADGFIKGAPDFVLEILSESTKTRDMVQKYNLYAQAGVKEYWILDPDSMILIKAVLNSDGYYITQNLLALGTIALETVNLSVDFDAVFPEREKPKLDSYEGRKF